MVIPKRSQALLAYLILNRDTFHPRQRLTFLFYPNLSDSQGRSAPRRDLFNLRRVLPEVDHYLRINAKTVQWNTDAAYCLDVTEFESALEQALQLPDEAVQEKPQWIETAIAHYRGPLLPAQDDE